MITRRDFLSAGGGAGAVLASPVPTAQRAARVYDVTAFGARGDGRANDTGAIQRAVAAARDADGGTVFFPGGSYLLGEELKLEGLNHVWFCGTGTASALVAPAALNFVILNLTAPAHTRISHLRFLGVASGSTIAIRAADATDLEIADCHMQLGNSGVRVFGTGPAARCHRLRVVNNTVEQMSGPGRRHHCRTPQPRHRDRWQYRSRCGRRRHIARRERSR